MDDARFLTPRLARIARAAEFVQEAQFVCEHGFSAAYALLRLIGFTVVKTEARRIVREQQRHDETRRGEQRFWTAATLGDERARRSAEGMSVTFRSDSDPT